MPNRKRRSRQEMEARRQLRPLLAAAGMKLGAARRRRRLTQAELAERTELSQPTISRIERGDGGTLSLIAWQRVATAVELPLELKLGPDAREETRDAGHLAIQELLLRLGRSIGLVRTFELPTRPSDPSAWVDVGFVDHRRRLLILLEAGNVLHDIGGSTRSFDRKTAQAHELAVAYGGDEPYAVRSCWILRATSHNRALVARYPELFATRFPGSSRLWVAALITGGDPPAERGLAWCDVAATRMFEWRRAAG